MLNKLIIKNIALIEYAEIDFKSGLNVLSGETGSGKSVIIDSLNFVLGAKADKSLIRSGENSCEVTAEFDANNIESIVRVFDELGFESESDLIISRKFTIDGKSTVRLNGNVVTVGMLKKFTQFLVDVYGQSEHFTLLNSSNQLKLIDSYGGEEIALIKSQLADLSSTRKQVLKQLEELGGDEHQRLVRIDLLNYQINEIEKSELKENEEDELKEIRDKLVHQEKIITALRSVKSALDDEGGISDIFSNAVRVSSAISNFGSEFNALSDRLDGAYAEVDDISKTVGDLLDSFDFLEYNADEINTRLEVIRALKKKYGVDYAEIMSFLEGAISERDKLLNANELAEELTLKISKLNKEIYDKYLILDELRRKNAQIFANNIVNELHELGMKSASFNVDFTDIPVFEECNFDSLNFNSLEFTFSANKGEPNKPLSFVISGGEMSRFMLAIKSQTAKYNDISTFVFDEIDAGISGNTAKVVGEKFCNIAKDVQLICISHLPQISAMADNNLLIEKFEIDNQTKTRVKTLTDEEKIYEIVRLSGGEKDNPISIEHAKAIIKSANSYKNI